MILAALTDAKRYATLHPGFAAAFSFLRRADLTSLPDGRYAIEENRVFAIVSRYTTRRPSQSLRWEAHRRYIDIQYLAAGCEVLGWSPVAALRAGGPYTKTNDCIFYRGRGEQIILRAGQFSIFFPEDAHAPGLAAGASRAVIKVVVKVRCRPGGQRMKTGNNTPVSDRRQGRPAR